MVGKSGILPALLKMPMIQHGRENKKLVWSTTLYNGQVEIGKAPMLILRAGKEVNQEKGVANPNKRDDHIHLQVGTQPQADHKEVGKGKATILVTILTVIRLGAVEKETRMITTRLP